VPKLFLETDNYLKRNSAYATILNNMGVIYAEAGDKQSAINCFKESILYTPDDLSYPNPKIGLKDLNNL
jgi:tetratricopeptide (TPR) repeat protein